MRAEGELQKAIKVKLELRKWGGRDILREREKIMGRVAFL